MKHLFGILFVLIFWSCNQNQDQPSQFVNSFIGTGGHGHTFPGPTQPFGMIQLSPDTRIEGWDGCSGYHYSDSIIFGFSHTHLSGTGIGDYCDLLLMPLQGDKCFDNGYKSKKNVNYSSSFKKQNEFAEPGYYEVLLDKHNIKCRLTTTERTGIHEYSFYNTETSSSVVIDLEHRDILLDWNIDINSQNSISGKRISKSWADEQHFYFYLEFSHSFEYQLNNESKPTKAFLTFQNLKKQPLLVKVGISTVSEENAKENLKLEAKHWDFEKYRKDAQKSWDNQLSKIDISTKNNSLKEIFYTSLYHTMIAPNKLSDRNGDFRSTDMKIYNDSNINFTVFSLWDTFRSTHPLFNLIERKRTSLFLNSFLNQYKNGGQLPIWELCANYTGCMIGYHVVSVILDACVKGITYDNYDKLYQAMLQISNRNELGIPEFKKKGYISSFTEPESVSKTLEYSYNDWCIYKMAQLYNDSTNLSIYAKRAQSYKNLYNKNSGFMQPKTNAYWKSGFIPSEVNYNYTEANSWQYSFFVPHDITGLIELHGSKKQLEAKIDELFTVNSKMVGRNQADITGLIGQYAHGNEPSHYMSYLYNMVDKPYKSQKIVNTILNKMYSTNPNGIIGNEDCGQMSAWYVLSSIGLFDVNPGDPYYLIQTPLFKEITLNLENGNKFTISSNSEDSSFIYIESIQLNGETINRNYLHINEILKGGLLNVNKTNIPNKDWPNGNLYTTAIKKYFNILKTPNIIAESNTFKDSIEITIDADKNTNIYYKTSNFSDFQIYQGPFYLNKTDTIYAYSKLNNKQSKIDWAYYLKYNQKKTIQLSSNFSNQYDAGGNNALVDGLRGPNNFLTGRWQGFYGTDFECVVDLGKEEKVQFFNIGAIQDVKSWIWLPKKVEYEVSTNGKDFKSIGQVSHHISEKNTESTINQFELKLNQPIKIKYVRIKAKNFGKCPSWHLGSGGTSWLFFDEITII